MDRDKDEGEREVKRKETEACKKFNGSLLTKFCFNVQHNTATCLSWFLNLMNVSIVWLSDMKSQKSVGYILYIINHSIVLMNLNNEK